MTGARVLVTGASRGIGAETATLLAAAGAKVAVNYRNKARRAETLVASIEAAGGEAIAIGADLTDSTLVTAMFRAIARVWGGLDAVILNASGGMERGMPADYAMRLNRDAQVDVVCRAAEMMARGSRVVFVTSHQAHFIRTTPTLPAYDAVARSKRAGEDAIRGLIPELSERGIEVVVVSGDVIEGTITAALLDRANPGTIAARRDAAGDLLDIAGFAAEVVNAAIEPVPEGHLRLVGDVSGFRLG